MPPDTDAEEELEELAGYLNALGHPRRLELLQQLRVPRTMGEIHLRPFRKESEGNPDRSMSRNAVERHLLLLKAIGVVGSRPGERDGRQVEEYLLQHSRVFQVVEELRGLTQLRPLDDFDLSVTQRDVTPTRAPAVTGAHVTLLSGPREGAFFELAGPGPWRIGRGAPCEIRLDYDAYASGTHATVERSGAGFRAVDLPTNRNGTLVNWRAIPRGGTRDLATGDVLRVGRSLLLFRGPA